MTTNSSANKLNKFQCILDALVSRLHKGMPIVVPNKKN